MRIWQLHFTRNNHQQTGQRCHKENSSSLQLHSRAIRGKYSCRGAKSLPGREIYILKNIKETDRVYTLSLFCVYQVAALFQKFSKLS